MERREIEGKIRHFAENLVALWQSNVCGRGKRVLKSEIVVNACWLCK